MMLYTIYKHSPLGDLILYGKDGFLEGLEFYKENYIQKEWIKDDNEFKEVSKQLKLYFQGKLKEFNLRLKLNTTPFKTKIYKELQKIPYGTTICYEELAKRVDNPKAARAVGNANGKNPIAIIIPCHRVISKSGKIGGYSSGIDKKIKLLKLEGIYIYE